MEKINLRWILKIDVQTGAGLFIQGWILYSLMAIPELVSRKVLQKSKEFLDNFVIIVHRQPPQLPLFIQNIWRLWIWITKKLRLNPNIWPAERRDL